jgi:hypothetical protein
MSNKKAISKKENLCGYLSRLKKLQFKVQTNKVTSQKLLPTAIKVEGRKFSSFFQQLFSTTTFALPFSPVFSTVMLTFFKGHISLLTLGTLEAKKHVKTV